MSTQKRAARHAVLIIEIRKFIAGAIFFNSQVAEHFHLNLTDSQCLNILDLTGSATPSQIAARTGLTSGGVTVVLDRLEKAGFISREPNPNDRRSLIIRTVPENMARIHAMYAEINRGMAELLGGYSAKDLEVIIGFFEKANRARAARGF